MQQALPTARYFLNRIRKIADSSPDQNNHQVCKRRTKLIPKPALQDLQLFHKVLPPKIYNGISLNLFHIEGPRTFYFQMPALWA
jgi:hypothetical protein